MLPPWFHITLVIKQQISTIIDQQFAGKRLDKVVVELFDGAYSRSRLSAWIRDGLVTIDGEAVMKPGHKLENGKKLQLTVPEADQCLTETSQQASSLSTSQPTTTSTTRRRERDAILPSAAP